MSTTDHRRMMNLNGFTLVVTGFPRSGTSMMMRMLRGGGIEVLADEDPELPGKDDIISVHKYSPYGCLELKNVADRLTGPDKLTVEETNSRAIKIVCPYATCIPLDRPVKAIFMQRDLTKIITSLIAMRTIWDEDIPETIAWTRLHLKNHNIPTLYVQYENAVKYPKATALEIKDFLEADLDVDGMVKVVDRNARTRYKKDKSLLGYGIEDELLTMNFDDHKDLKVKAYRMPDAGGKT